jgi:hypothetical protein
MRASASEKARALWEDPEFAARAIMKMDPEARARARATCLERYGAEHWLASEAGEEFWRNHELSDGTATNPMHIPEFVRRQ